MQKIEVGTIKSTLISNDLPEIMENQSLVSTNNQPIKIIGHQEIYSLFDMLEQLNSWQHTLNDL